MPGLQPVCVLHPPSLHCCRLECIEHHQVTPTCPCGRWHIPDNLHLPDVSKGSARNRCQLRHRHILFSLCNFLHMDCGQTIPSAPSCRQHHPIMKTSAAPWKPPALHHPYCPLPILQPEFFELLVTALVASHLADSQTHPQGPIPLPPSPPCTSLSAHMLLLLSSSSSSQLSVCKLLLRFFFFCEAPSSLFNWHLEHPCFIWYLAPPPCRLQCLSDRRKTSFPPMCTTLKMVSHPTREE